MRASNVLAGALLGALISGCSHHEASIEIPFSATIAGAPFSCGAVASGFVPSDLRFYVHDVALVDDAGQRTPIELTEDGIWQRRGVALLDFENGKDSCADGTTGVHTMLLGHAAARRYHALRFTVGVPFDRNHGDAAGADPPLNLGRMHWGWQGGYKFFRFEGSDAAFAFRFHLGSTGCEGTIGNITGCSRPNRAEIHLDGFVLGRSRVQVDLGAVLARGSGEAHPTTTVSCMSEKDDPNCRTPFAALGLDVASGAASETQDLFKIIPVDGDAS